MSGRIALIAGASGLVGSCLLRRLLGAPEYVAVIAIGRRELDVTHSKLTQRTVPRFDTASLNALPKVHDVFCCLGTTIRKAGSQSGFRAIDHDAVVALARAAQQSGALQFLHVTAIDANPRSRVFYNRVKGEAERDVAAIGMRTTVALRPSILDGPRSESRRAERVGLAFARMLAPVLGRYRPTLADAVAMAMVREALEDRPGHRTIESNAIEQRSS